MKVKKTMRVMAVIISACLFLMACTLDDALTSGSKTIAVFDGQTTVTAPEGFCFDRSASRTSDGFTVAVPCGSSRLALITTQLGEVGSATVVGSENALVRFIQHPDGRALLSGVGDPSTIFVHRSQVNDHQVEVFFSETSPLLADGFEPTQWRAFFDYQGRMATVSVRWWDQSPLDQTQGLAILRAATTALVVN